jgi:7-cyano-7-deazaguanine synthase
MTEKAIILLSGGLDSATTLAIASTQNFECYALSFNYSQRHKIELLAAKKIAEDFSIMKHKILDIDLTQIGGSALTDPDIDVPDLPGEGIPVTYVPARNTIFLSFALAYAETLEANNIFIGVNAVDYSGYPDCRPEYIRAFQEVVNLATRASVQGNRIQIHTPLIDMSKADIILKAVELNVNLESTISCYQPDNEGQACGTCDSCRFRQQGFVDAGISDRTRYASH